MIQAVGEKKKRKDQAVATEWREGMKNGGERKGEGDMFIHGPKITISPLLQVAGPLSPDPMHANARKQKDREHGRS